MQQPMSQLLISKVLNFPTNKQMWPAEVAFHKVFNVSATAKENLSHQKAHQLQHPSSELQDFKMKKKHLTAFLRFKEMSILCFINTSVSNDCKNQWGLPRIQYMNLFIQVIIKIWFLGLERVLEEVAVSFSLVMIKGSL